MSGVYPEPEVWPDDDWREDEPKGDDLAKEVLDGEELREHFKRQRPGRW